VLIGASVVVAVVCLAVSVLLGGDPDLVARTGVHTPGEVVSTGSSIAGPFIRVRYDADGSEHVSQINLDEDRSYRPGDAVDVIYRPHELDHVRTATDENEPGWSLAWAVLAVTAAPGAALAGVLLVVRARRARSIMRRGPWRQITLHGVVLSRGRSPKVLLVLDGEPEPVVRRVLTVFPHEGAFRTVTHVWVAGDLEHVSVAARARDGRFYAIRSARLASDQRRWETYARRRVRSSTWPRSTPAPTDRPLTTSP
jgi:hypothetical protein